MYFGWLKIDKNDIQNCWRPNWKKTNWNIYFCLINGSLNLPNFTLFLIITSAFINRQNTVFGQRRTFYHKLRSVFSNWLEFFRAVVPEHWHRIRPHFFVGVAYLSTIKLSIIWHPQPIFELLIIVPTC